MEGLYGKFRAIVVDLKDEEKRGRIKVKCPKVYGEYESPWCLPCVPMAIDMGGTFMLPDLGDVIWIEFEEGNSKYPIWVGSWWIPEKTPLGTEYDKGIKRIEIKHKKGQLLSMNEKGEIAIGDGKGSSIWINDKGEVVITATKVLFKKR